ncbi:hypothetical protein M0J18_RS13045 [Morganella morganii]|nr:hypothetical protein [Morganella morganii]
MQKTDSFSGITAFVAAAQSGSFEISEQQTTLSGRLRIDLPAAFGHRRVIPAPSATAKYRTTRLPGKSG